MTERRIVTVGLLLVLVVLLLALGLKVWAPETMEWAVIGQPPALTYTSPSPTPSSVHSYQLPDNALPGDIVQFTSDGGVRLFRGTSELTSWTSLVLESPPAPRQ